MPEEPEVGENTVLPTEVLESVAKPTPQISQTSLYSGSRFMLVSV